MSAADLLKVSGPMISNPPMPDDIRSTLTTRKYSDGRSFLEGWRDEIKLLIDNIAAEKTWYLQRQRLIRFRVAAVSWIAVYKAVDNEPRISLWRSYVQGVGEFATNPEIYWPMVLAKVFCFAVAQNAVLGGLGIACYATGEAVERHLTLLTDLREHAIEKGLTLDRGIQDIAENDYDLAESLMDDRNRMVLPKSQKLFGFLLEIGDRIETGTIQESTVATRWEELCNDVNAQIQALGLSGQLGTDASILTSQNHKS